MSEDLPDRVRRLPREAVEPRRRRSPSFVVGCSQGVWTRDEPVLVRNYDYAWGPAAECLRPGTSWALDDFREGSRTARIPSSNAAQD